MNIMTPAQVASNRTARLVAEAFTPVYSTETKPVVREHIMAVEIDDQMGRFWSHMPESEVDEFLALYPGGLSDLCCSAKCWCQK
jgi:hypothetical protein